MRLGVEVVEANRHFVIAAVEEDTSTGKSPTVAGAPTDMKLAALCAARTTDLGDFNLHPTTAQW